VAAGGGGGRLPPRREDNPEPSEAVLLLDTNALLLPFREAFPLERELARVAPGRSPRVPDSARAELERLARRGVLGGSAALAWALTLARCPAPGRGDRAIEAAARRMGAWVVTGDRALAERLRAVGITVLRPSGHGRLLLIRGARAPPRRATGSPARGNR
ncbi:MAG: hypothetical protein ACRECR_04410, partial [Thermoplasmata archaeon]